MKPGITILTIAVAANVALSFYLLATRDNPTANETPTAAAGSKTTTDQLQQLERSLTGLRTELRDLQSALVGPQPEDDAPDAGQPDPAVALGDRLRGIERSLAQLQRAMDGVSLEAASAERNELFIAENGHLVADEYFEAGKFAIAGEGYLKFLEAHPDHPDHRGILERARTAFRRAGYGDKAVWAQEELMRIYPETRPKDLMTLADLEKNSGDYRAAAQHAAESAALYEDSQRYWNLLYSAWYTQLGEGNQAGLNAYRDVQRQITAAGYGDDRLGERAQEKIDEIERQIAAGN